MAPKVLWLSNYRDNSGWAQAGRDQILSLDAAGIDVCLRPLKLDTSEEPLPPRILELEQNQLAGANVVIQFLLPHMMERHEGVKNIGYYCQETTGFGLSGWADKLNLMDEVWVPSEWQRQACGSAGVSVPIHVVNFACDLSRFQKKIPKLPALEQELAGRFTFYTIGELIRRKNYGGLLKAFHTEFSMGEPVALVIKTSGDFAHTNEFSKQVKLGLKLYKNDSDYMQEIVVTDRLPDEAILALHKTCDVFVSPSFGEAWSLPAFDSMALGKTPIVSDSTGFREFVTDKVGWLIPTRSEPVFGANESLSLIHTARESWESPCLYFLQRAMRQAYELHDTRKRRSLAGIDKAYQFSYAAVGLRMKELLGA